MPTDQDNSTVPKKLSAFTYGLLVTVILLGGIGLSNALYTFTRTSEGPGIDNSLGSILLANLLPVLVVQWLVNFCLYIIGYRPIRLLNDDNKIDKEAMPGCFLGLVFFTIATIIITSILSASP